MSDFRALLKSFRDAARSEREKGNYFERIAVDFIKNDPGMAQEYEDAWLFSDWAKTNGWSGSDTGIDAVAKLRDEGGYCAIQCKFYREGHRLAKADIDSFFTASGKHPFVRRLIIDTTDAPWSTHAEEALDGQQIPTTRIGLDRLSESPINWSAYLHDDKIEVAPKKQLRSHQTEALDCVRDGLADADRGKLIMACGTGKTFTGLKIAEAMVGRGKSVLFLVPSLSLMSQTIREWTIDSETPLASFAVCSDAQVGKRRKNNDDVAEVEAHDLDYPATTNAAKLAAKVAKAAPDRMTAVFATYQSLPVVAAAQAEHGMAEFDLILCDEAHRTTGASFPGQEDSNFIKVHDQSFIQGKKRIYMTATPRVFGDAVRGKAAEASVELCSMDDEALYGKTLFARGFGWAVEKQLLTDYKVIVLAVDEAMVSSSMQNRLADGTSELKLDDATKIIGCYKALTKNGLSEDVAADPQPMERALAFCKDIASSKLIKDEFAAVIAEYLASEEGQETEAGRPRLGCELRHVDGTFNAKERTRALEWLKEDTNGEACRILTNARCLSEGVDVPALDAILFMHPRKSQIDVVQSVGRVMRRAEGKRMGYIILPIGVPAGMTPEEALKDNERYRVVWDILNALRSHDERFDSTINKMGLGVDVSDHIEVVAVTNKLPTNAGAAKGKANIGQGSAADDNDGGDAPLREVSDTQAEFIFDEFAKAIMAKIVKKCGKRDYWEDWATDIAKIAQTHITRITTTVAKEGSKERKAFESFLAEIRDDLNDSISEAEAIEMLAQHIITKPVFEALFEDHSFARNNPVSVAMQSVLDVLQEQNLEKEAEALQNFYDSVRRRAAGIDSAEAKQRIIVELYDKFFRKAFPRMTEKLGIVYTPVEIVDFIIRSVDEVLRSEFDQNLGSEGVHIIDPFTGTGTFVTRLLQLGVIPPDDLQRKYRKEIHANEIVLLAYYIAAINIEAVYGSLSGEYEPFKGICLTDTFQLHERDDLVSGLLADNSQRRLNQKRLPLRVIIGNPPYAEGQKSANENNQNVDYPHLDGRIEKTYAARSDAKLVNSLYNSYVRALRWASDRLNEGGGGVSAFVVNAGWLDGDSTDGIRRCFEEDFSAVHLFHLRGNARTQGEQRRREKDNVFGQASRSSIVIAILVKKPGHHGQAAIKIHDIGDYLTRAQKLDRIRQFGSLAGIDDASGWSPIKPNAKADWLRQRGDAFDRFIPIGTKTKGETAVFEEYSGGVMTNRDAWVINASSRALTTNVRAMAATYNSERERIQNLGLPSGRKAREKFVDDEVTNDATRISWSAGLKASLLRNTAITVRSESAARVLYRPFSRQWLYFDRDLNERVLQMPKIFPNADAVNRVIVVKNRWSGVGHFATMSDSIVEQQTDGGAQCFPLYIYKQVTTPDDGGLPLGDSPGRERRSGISSHFLNVARAAYPGLSINEESVFYYVYGILHSFDYRRDFNDELCKELPRIPLVATAEDFQAFEVAGRALGDLHVGYENAEPYPVTIKEGDLSLAVVNDPEAFYRVEKMKFGGKRPNLDKSTVIYNPRITMTNIPLEAYDYVVNGKPALEWVMERQVVKTDKDSGIVNDANRYAIETVGDPAYPLKLFQRVITVSLETMKIVRSLPPLDIMGDDVATASTSH